VNDAPASGRLRVSGLFGLGLSSSVVFVEKRGTLLIGQYVGLGGAVGHLGNGNDNRRNKQDSHDGEGKDPLESDGLVKELADANCCGEDAEGEAHGVVLVDCDEEAAVNQNGPDEDVSEDSSDQVVRSVDHDGSVPVDGDEVPSQGCGDYGPVDESGIRVMSEVQRRQIEEVGDDHDFSDDEEATDKQHNEGELQQVVEDKVTPDTGCGIDIIRVA